MERARSCIHYLAAVEDAKHSAGLARTLYIAQRKKSVEDGSTATDGGLLLWNALQGKWGCA